METEFIMHYVGKNVVEWRGAEIPPRHSIKNVFVNPFYKTSFKKGINKITGSNF